MKPKSGVYKLSRHFHITVKKLQQIKSGVYRIQSRTGKIYCVKRMNYSVEFLQWIDQTLGEIKKRGFNRLAWRDSSKTYGRTLYAKTSNASPPFIITPWIEGRTPKDDSLQDMSDCGRTLAEFHQAGQSIQFAPKVQYNHVGRWPALLNAQLALLKRAVAIARIRSGNELDQLLNRHGAQLLERATNALEMLRLSDYRGACIQSEKFVTVCHGDSGPKNFVIAQNGIWLIDFETLRIDLRVYDLYRLMRLAGKKNGWDPKIADSILQGYQSISPLEHVELMLLHVWLQFPIKICKLLKRYNKAAQLHHPALIRKMEKTLKQEESESLPKFLNNLQQYASQR